MFAELVMFWTLLNDPIKKMAKAIYRRLQGIYQRITISATRDIVEELQEPSTAAPSMKSDDGGKDYPPPTLFVE